MADVLKMDPARIARLRNPERYEQIDPARVLEIASPERATVTSPLMRCSASKKFRPLGDCRECVTSSCTSVPTSVIRPATFSVTVAPA